MTIAIVAGTELLVGEHLEGPSRFLEAVGRLVVAGILVRMEADREFPVRLRDLGRRRRALDAQNLVKVTLLRHGGAGRPAGHRPPPGILRTS